MHAVKGSCDLLEKSYLCGINNNTRATKESAQVVVICLKSLTFVVSITTNFIIKSKNPPL